MVATTLLATATAGGLTALGSAQSARRDAGALQELHERAQYVFASLEPELQMAGYFGDAAPAPQDVASIPPPALRCGPEPIRRLDLAVESMPQWTLPCEARGGGAAAGSQVLVVRRASARMATGPAAGRAQWMTVGGAGSLYWLGDAPWSNAAQGTGGELRELIVRIYYVARESDGDPSLPALRVKSLTSIAGVPAFLDTEVMHGIEQLQIELQPSPAAPQSVRVRLRVRAAPGTREITRHFTLRNAAH
jgi:hypothetical protein